MYRALVMALVSRRDGGYDRRAVDHRVADAERKLYFGDTPPRRQQADQHHLHAAPDEHAIVEYAVGG
jgi:hypothetical protein